MTEVASAGVAKMHVNGEWVGAISGDTQEIINPSDGSVVDTVPRGNREDARAAIQAAENAFPAWADTAPDERAAWMMAGIERVKEHSKELAALLSKEQGKPVFEAAGEIHHFLHGMAFYAGLASKVRGAQVPLPADMGKHSYGLVMKRPVGVCGAIVPWNFPITLMGTKLGPALAAGNTIVVKPAGTTPLTTLKIIGLFNETPLPKDVPPGVLNCVTGPGREVGEELLQNPVVRRIAFTGESGTGRRVMEVAGPQFKRITLELGGSDPMIVMPDADLRKAVSGAMIGRFWNCGQACLAVKRLYLHADIYDEFLDGLLKKVAAYEPGDPATRPEKPKLRMGPLHTAAQREEIEEQLADAVSQGAEVLIGGTRPDDPALAKGHFFLPAVVANVPHKARLVQDEVFGPVLPVFKISDLDEAIALANDNQYGLGSSIWTNNMKWANQAIREVQAGVTWVNQIHYGYDELPFGGVKASGLGHEHGPEAMEYYQEKKGAVIGGLA
ncbi:MAG TPA: aldehyde dehydrogenase family protein [bacterium]|nr:aldehyde dehydrogenase family protein [bacterium]